MALISLACNPASESLRAAALRNVVPLPSGTDLGWLVPTCFGDPRTGFRHHAVGTAPHAARGRRVDPLQKTQRTTRVETTPIEITPNFLAVLIFWLYGTKGHDRRILARAGR
jgi:hypothetical protein